jgi:hypothetical protein
LKVFSNAAPIARKMKNNHVTPNCLSFFRHSVSLDISDAILKRQRQTNSNFMELKRVFRDTSTHERIQFLSDLVAEENWRHWPKYDRVTLVQADIQISS